MALTDDSPAKNSVLACEMIEHAAQYGVCDLEKDDFQSLNIHVLRYNRFHLKNC